MEQNEELLNTIDSRLVSISADVAEVKFILAGNKLNGYTGMVKDVSELKVDVAELKEWKNNVQEKEIEAKDGVKIKHSAWSIAAAWVAAIISFLLLLLNHKTK